MNAYRTPAPMPLALVTDLTDLLPNPREACPECGLNLLGHVCKAGHRSSLKYEFICDRAHCNARLLPTITGVYCGPHKRRRYGFLRLRRCREPGTHLHQHCPRCEWRGTSKAAPSGGSAT